MRSMVEGDRRGRPSVALRAPPPPHAGEDHFDAQRLAGASGS